MNYRIVRIVFAAMLFVVASGAVASAQQALTPDRVNEVGRGRYVAATDFRVDPSITFAQPDYKFETRLPEGFGRATAAELGVGGKKFWNEYPGIGAALVIMDPNTVLIYDTVSRVPLYVTGCVREGKTGGLNRIKEETPPPPPPLVELPPTPKPEPEPQPEPQPEFGCVILQKETTNHLGSAVLTVGQVAVYVGSQWTQVPYNGVVRFENVPLGEVSFGEQVPGGYKEYLKVPTSGRVFVRAGTDCAGVIIKNRQLPPVSLPPRVPVPSGPGPCGAAAWKCWIWVPPVVAVAVYYATRDDDLHKDSVRVRIGTAAAPRLRPAFGLVVQF